MTVYLCRGVLRSKYNYGIRLTRWVSVYRRRGCIMRLALSSVATTAWLASGLVFLTHYYIDFVVDIPFFI